MNEIEYNEMCESAAIGQTLSECVKAIMEEYDATTLYDLQRGAYKYTDCGPSVGFRLMDPCPTCASMIFKIDGCDQMWCTQCQTTFSWRTGQIETGRTHNPHYYEYLRMRNNGVIPREPGDIPGGQCNMNQYPDAYIMNAYIGNMERMYPQYNIRQYGIMDCLRALLHNTYTIQGWAPTRYTPQLHEELRIKYMINEISEATYKKELQKREKDRNKRRDMTDILVMFEAVAREIMHKIIREAEPGKLNEYMIELNTLRDYTNQHMMMVSKRYNCVYPCIRENWVMLSAKA